MKWHNTFDNCNLLLNGVRGRERERVGKGGRDLVRSLSGSGF